MTNSKSSSIAHDRASADQGDFFFVNARLSDGNEYKRPVFVVGKHQDSNDAEDVIVCSCTKQPSRSDYDKPVKLKYDTVVRTNKFYTIRRDQMLFKIKHNLTPAEIDDILDSCRASISQ